MKTNSFILRHLIGIIVVLSLSNITLAGSPLWTFTPLTDTTLSVPSNDTAIVQYQVTNRSARTHTLTMRPIVGITQVTSGIGICANPFILNGNSSCTLSLEIDGSQLISPISDGPIICEQGSMFQCYRPSSSNILHITQGMPNPDFSVTEINPSSGSASGGTGVTITGTGFASISDVTFDGIAATSINVVNSTTLTAVSPAHTAGNVDVVITNSSSESVTLTNGYTYLATAVGQTAYGGVIGCLNGGINNLISAIADNSAGIGWGGSGIILNASSTTDGATNTATIVSALGVNGGTPYPAQICNDYEIDSQGNSPCEAGNTCYNDWFLPAGNNSTASGQLNCLYTNNVAIGGFTSESGYWSSTEGDALNAWYEYFSNGYANSAFKSFITIRVRCVRAFVP